MTILTPNDILYLLHYYVGDPNHMTKQAAGVSRQRLISMGLLAEDEDTAVVKRITGKGMAYIHALQKLPLPKQYWGYELHMEGLSHIKVPVL